MTTADDGGLHHESDRKLAQRTLAGDSAAFAALHRRYYARVYRLALLRCRSVQDAEDVAAETFVRAIIHLPSYRFQGPAAGAGSLFPWLARIAGNLIVDQGRRRGGTSFVSLEAGGTEEGVRALIEGLASGAPDPHELAERTETQALLRAAITALPREQAEAVTLRFVGDLSLKEIAHEMGKTEGAIKSLLHRALVNLRRSLTGQDRTALASVFGHDSLSTPTMAAGNSTLETERQQRHSSGGGSSTAAERIEW